MAVLHSPDGWFDGREDTAVLSVVLGVLVVLSAAYCLYLSAASRRAIIAFATAHYLIAAAASLVDDAWLGTTLAAPVLNIQNLLRVIIVTMIWAAYFHKVEAREEHVRQRRWSKQGGGRIGVALPGSATDGDRETWVGSAGREAGTGELAGGPRSCMAHSRRITGV